MTEIAPRYLCLRRWHGLTHHAIEYDDFETTRTEMQKNRTTTREEISPVEALMAKELGWPALIEHLRLKAEAEALNRRRLLALEVGRRANV